MRHIRRRGAFAGKGAAQFGYHRLRLAQLDPKSADLVGQRRFRFPTLAGNYKAFAERLNDKSKEKFVLEAVPSRATVSRHVNETCRAIAHPGRSSKSSIDRAAARQRVG